MSQTKIEIELLPAGNEVHRGDVVLNPEDGLIAVVLWISGEASLVLSANGTLRIVASDRLRMLPLQPGSKTTKSNFVELVDAYEVVRPALFDQQARRA